MDRNKGLILLIVCVLLSSCRLGQPYQRDENMTPPAAYNYSAVDSESLADIPWWELYQDGVLTYLIEEALCNNLDLYAAAARIKQAEANLGVVRSNLNPRINYGAEGSYTFSTIQDQESVSAFVPISYQVDLWGRFRNLNDAAFQNYLATEEAYRNVTITLISSVANAYFLLRDLDNRLVISQNTAESWKDNLDIIMARNRAGLISEVDVNQAIIQLEEARSLIQTFRRLRQQTENSISVLLGSPPFEIPRGELLQDQILPPSPPAGLPSELLDRRPDLLIAERNLQAQYYINGATEALQYPSLTLSADLGATFLDPSAAFASLGAQLFGPLFNSGENKKRYEIELARSEELLANYKKSFLNAIREVEDALIAVETYELELQSRRTQMESANKALELSWVRYENGVTSYLEILDLQRSSFSSMLSASEAMQLNLSSTVNLYLALGGGWDSSSDEINRINDAE